MRCRWLCHVLKLKSKSWPAVSDQFVSAHPIILGLIAGSRETHQRCDRAEADPGSFFKRTRGRLYCTPFQNVVETSDPEPSIAIGLQK